MKRPSYYSLLLMRNGFVFLSIRLLLGCSCALPASLYGMHLLDHSFRCSAAREGSPLSSSLPGARSNAISTTGIDRALSTLAACTTGRAP
ncbi:hypothetical protein V8F06_012998 [Rhypophila decipiens]